MWEKELSTRKQFLAQNIKSRRNERGLAQEALALEAGIDRTLVSKIERLRANPTLEILVKLSLALEISISALLQSPKNK